VVRTSIAEGGEQADFQRQFLSNATDRFVATLNGEEAVGGRPAWALTLVPKRESPYKVIRIWVDREDYLVRRFEMTEENNSVRRVELRNLKVNQPISDALFTFTPPAAMQWTSEFLGDLAYLVVAIVLVSAIESLLCSRMADRLADNRGMPFNPNKELWGQGVVQILIPLMNGFPHTGALARTATNIKLGAVSPLAGIFKATLKLLMALFLAQYLEIVPMASIGGILLYVSTAMVKPAEVKQVLAHNAFHICLMVYTAIVVVLTDFLIGVVTAIAIWALLYRLFDKPVPVQEQAAAMQ